MNELKNLIASTKPTREFNKRKRVVNSPSPFVAWVGGKRQLLDSYSSLFPTDFNKYFEPFAGGAAVFYYLYNKYGDTKQYILSDINAELVITYNTIKTNPLEIKGLLDLLNARHTKEFYYAVRNMDRVKLSNGRFEKKYDIAKNLSAIETSARFLYLNKTCFNSIYRVNKDNLFNVPIGTSLRKDISDNGTLEACSAALKHVEVKNCSYRDLDNQVGKKDLVYLDPPYAPLTATSNFVSYTKDGFDTGDQIKLRDYCNELDKRGVYFMVSNSNCQLITDLYKKYNQHIFVVNRNINRDKTKRKNSAEEVLITNF